MDSSETLRALLGIAEEIGIQVRLAPATAEWGGAPGGTLVRLKGREILFLNTSAPLADQLEAAAGALRGRPAVEQRYLPPQIREMIDGSG